MESEDFVESPDDDDFELSPDSFDDDDDSEPESEDFDSDEPDSPLSLSFFAPALP